MQPNTPRGSAGPPGPQAFSPGLPLDSSALQDLDTNPLSRVMIGSSVDGRSAREGGSFQSEPDPLFSTTVRGFSTPPPRRKDAPSFFPPPLVAEPPGGIIPSPKTLPAVSMSGVVPQQNQSSQLGWQGGARPAAVPGAPPQFPPAAPRFDQQYGQQQGLGPGVGAGPAQVVAAPPYGAVAPPASAASVAAQPYGQPGFAQGWQPQGGAVFSGPGGNASQQYAPSGAWQGMPPPAGAAGAPAAPFASFAPPMQPAQSLQPLHTVPPSEAPAGPDSALPLDLLVPAPPCFLFAAEQCILRAYNVQSLNAFPPTALLRIGDLVPDQPAGFPLSAAPPDGFHPPDTLRASESIERAAKIRSGVSGKFRAEVDAFVRERAQKGNDRLARLRNLLTEAKERHKRLQGDAERAEAEKRTEEEKLARLRRDEQAMQEMHARQQRSVQGVQGAMAPQFQQFQQLQQGPQNAFRGPPGMPGFPSLQQGQLAQQTQLMQPMQQQQASAVPAAPALSAAVSQFANAMLTGQLPSQPYAALPGQAPASTHNFSLAPGSASAAEPSVAPPVQHASTYASRGLETEQALDKLLSSQAARDYAVGIEKSLKAYNNPISAPQEASFYPRANDALQTAPPFEQLLRYSYDDLSRVRDFSVSNEHGKIEWPGLLDLRGKDLKQIRIYPGGFDLGAFYPDRTAIIYLRNMEPAAGQGFDAFRSQLERVCLEYGQIRILECSPGNSTVVLRRG